MRGRLSLYRRYATRSLLRGGQRSVLAVFCIAVGVMAIVALRLAGDMIKLSVTTNVRDVLGGDVSVQSTAVPLSRADLGRLDALRSQGVITGYAAVGTTRGTVRSTASHSSQVLVQVLDDPSHFPLTGSPRFEDPADGSDALLAAPGTILLNDFVATQLDARPGDSLRLNLLGGGLDVRVAGVLDNSATAGGATVAYISRATYDSASHSSTLGYGIVDVLTADPARADQAAQALRADFPQATVQTVQEAIDQNTDVSDQFNQFLTIVGLLALLIGGVGIVNTMQVSLSRRRIEIAMLKTAGYRRSDLYALFALEAAILGLAGGVLGTAAGTGVSALVRVLIQRVVPITIDFHVSAAVLVTGVVVGLATALIFGLLPIVRAASVRPQAVIRDMVRSGGAGSAAQTAALYVLLVVLFTGLSLSLVGSLVTTLAVVVATLVGIVVLSGVFLLVVLLVGALPVPERPRAGFFILVTAVTALAALVARSQHALGAVLLVLTASGYIVVFLPRRMKTSLKLALRSVGRSRGRTSSTLVALFVGVFTIGLILVLGQDISAKIDDSLNSLSSFNVFAIAPPREAQTVRSLAPKLPGIQDHSVTDDVAVTPQQLDGVPFSTLAPPPGVAGRTRTESQFRFSAINGVEGYDLRSNNLPDLTVNLGRSLGSGDAGTTNVLVRNDARNGLGVRLGSSITVLQPTTGRTVTLRVVGFYLPVRAGANGLRFNFFVEPVLGDRSVVDGIAGPDLQTVVSMKLAPAQKFDALRQLEHAAPDTVVLDLADFATLISRFLSNLIDLLVALASLALFAGIVIIANTVALAMLERRREMGILKAVGHSSRSVLSQVLIENGVVGGIGAIAGMAAVTLATGQLGDRVLKTDLGVGTPIVIAVIAGIVAIVVVVAGLVAYGPTRVRPLEVLRYE
jgi:putative ABC transport system permease protein